MTDVYVVRNQLGHYWGKSKVWVDGSEAKALMRTTHEDEAVNTLFELSSKDFELRGEVVATIFNERGNPVVEASDIPVPGSEEVAGEADEADASSGDTSPENATTSETAGDNDAQKTSGQQATTQHS